MTKTAKLWSLRRQKQGFSTYSTFSRKSGSSYEKIDKKHFFMSQNNHEHGQTIEPKTKQFENRNHESRAFLVFFGSK
jgi:hypothetical protein